MPTSPQLSASWPMLSLRYNSFFSTFHAYTFSLVRHEYLNSMSIFQLEALEDDQSLTVAAMQEQIHAKIDAMSPQLRELVLAAAPRPPRGGRGMGGMGGGFKGKQGGRRFRK